LLPPSVPPKTFHDRPWAQTFFQAAVLCQPGQTLLVPRRIVRYRALTAIPDCKGPSAAKARDRDPPGSKEKVRCLHRTSAADRAHQTTKWERLRWPQVQGFFITDGVRPAGTQFSILVPAAGLLSRRNFRLAAARPKGAASFKIGFHGDPPRAEVDFRKADDEASCNYTGSHVCGPGRRSVCRQGECWRVNGLRAKVPGPLFCGGTARFRDRLSIAPFPPSKRVAEGRIAGWRPGTAHRKRIVADDLIIDGRFVPGFSCCTARRSLNLPQTTRR